VSRAPLTFVNSVIADASSQAGEETPSNHPLDHSDQIIGDLGAGRDETRDG
jgi:hypothetical protein